MCNHNIRSCYFFPYIQSENITIEDEKTPLAAAEDTCGIHWLVLLLTTGVIGYYAIRVVSESKAEQREISKQEA